jgi:trehalose 6-phosphate synthase
MKIISYRGPSSAGGLSSAVGRAWRKHSHHDDLWCHIENNGLQVLSHKTQRQSIARIPQEIIDGHYRYCNEFLWPVMHDLEEHASFNLEHNRQYEQLNKFISQMACEESIQSGYFIHDYHFALLPRFLRQNNQSRSAIFWHIPWPEKSSYTALLADIAKGMLSANVIGFHTQEYAERFMRFIEYNLPQFISDPEKMLVKSSRFGNWPRNKDSWKEKITEIVVAPVGIDFRYWSSLAHQSDESLSMPFNDKPFILSVDRIDYTKGVDKRLQAIDCFFERFPHWRGEVRFVQACDRTRPGLAAFDNYWQDCQRLRQRLDQRWSNSNWSPVVWLPSALSASQLAQIYRDAEVMLVNPVKDGLNLTAKEYVACQVAKPGVLALSPGAGVWHELGHYCLPVQSEEPEKIAQCINKSLVLGSNEKLLRMSLLSDKVQANTLASWWYRMVNKLAAETEEPATLVKTAY